MSNNISNIINKLYNKVGYSEKYGGSLWFTVIFCLVSFLILSYYYVYNNLQPIKADWENQRCKPNIMPFAGLINPPESGEETPFEFTANNFTNCIQSILSDIIGIFTAPFYYLINVFSEVLSIISEAIQGIRKFLDSLRNAFISTASEVMDRILNVLIPLQLILIKVKDMFNKSQGIMSSAVYTLLSIYYTLQSSVGAIVEIIVVILLALAVLILMFFAIPFGAGIPFAIPLLVIFIMISIPGIMVYIIEVMILKKMVNPLPGIPTCFFGDTQIKLQNGNKVKIKDLDVGMILENNNIVTAKMKLAFINKDIYNLGNVLCTGEHKVLYDNNWIEIKNHPESILTNKKSDYLYCINTSNKTIIINDITFADWDELNNSEIEEIKNKCSNYLPKNSNLEDFHKYLDGGFHENTKIELQDGDNINIKDIEVNNILKFGERVIGIIKIKADDLEVKEFILENGYNFKGGPNLHICDVDLGMVSTLDLYGIKSEEKEKYLYHLITDKSTFYVNGVRFYDYNSCIEKYLDLENIRLLKAVL